MPTSPVAAVGVLSDTHVPDLQKALPARAFDILSAQQVEVILHAGDICSPRLLRELGRVAPVYAVRGNRDVFWPRNWTLPTRRIIEVGAIRVGLTHGHPPFLRYAAQRLLEVVSRPPPRPGIDPRSLRPFPADVRVVVYGHDHVPNVQWIDSTLYLNPGTASPAFATDQGSTLAILRVDETDVSAEIVSLE